MAREIERGVVTVTTELAKGFRRNLIAQLKEATAGITAKVKVEASDTQKDIKALRASINRVAREAAKGTSIKVKVEAVGGRSAVKAIKEVNDERADGDKKEIAAKIKLAREAARLYNWQKQSNTLHARALRENAAYDAKRITDLATHERNKRAADVAHLRALRENAAFDARRAALDAKHAAFDAKRIADQRALGVLQVRAEREMNAEFERRGREADRQRAATGKDSALKRVIGDFQSPIDFGGKGIRPTNALIAAAVALSPVLLAVASSAAQASTSLVALGSAAIGAGAAFTAIAVAFTGPLAAFKQYQNAQKSARVESANAAIGAATTARTAVAASRRVRDAEQSLADANRRSLQAQVSLNRARADALADLRELRETVSDLALSEEGARIGLARSQERLAEVMADGKSTALDRREALLGVAEAEDSLSDVIRERRERHKELIKVERQGIDSSDKVKSALEAVADSRRAVADAREGVADARQSAAEARQAASMTRMASAAVELEDQLSKLAPAGRALFNWLRRSEPAFEAFARRVQQATLPGFLSFLKDVASRNGGVTSTADVASGAVARMGKVVSDTAARLGRAAKSAWFKREFATINRNNEKAFGRFGQATVVFLRPLMTLIARSSPLLVRFSDYVLGLANRFDRWVLRMDRAGKITEWFKDAGDEMAKWWDIATNVLGILRNLFQASSPSGKSLVDRLGKWTADIERNSREGGPWFERIKAFFDRLEQVDYGRLSRVVAQLTLLGGAILLISKAISLSPIGLLFTFMGVLATKYPDQASTALDGLAKGIGAVGKFVSENETAILTLMGLFTAYRLFAAVKGGGSLGALFGRGKSPLEKMLGEGFKRVTTMTVTAGVVNVYGGGGLGPGGGAPGAGGKGKDSRFKMPKWLGGAAGAAGALAGGLAGVLGGATAAVLTIDVVLDKPGASLEGVWALINGPKAYSEWSKKNAPAFKRFFSHTLPGWLNLEDGAGWAGYGKTLLRDLAVDLPNMLNPGVEDGWSGLGKSMASGLARGVAGGISDLGRAFFGDWIGNKIYGWFADWWGIESPSTVMAGLGVSLADGLLVGVRGRINALAGSFQAVGSAVVRFIAAPLAGLGAAIAGPIRSALAFIDATLIKSVNTVLAALKAPLIPTLLGSGGKAKNTVSGLIANTAKSGRPGNTQGLATGGQVAGSSPSRTADNILARVTAKEWVMPVDAVEHYGPDYMRAVQNKQLPAYAKGGPVWGPQAGPPLWRSMWAWVNKRFPSASLSSSYRQGDPGYHGTGQAIDIVAPGVRTGTGVARQIFQAIKGSFFHNIAELIWDFAGNKAVWQGREHFFTGPGAGPGTHADHIHAALARGGLAPGPNGLPALSALGSLPVPGLNKIKSAVSAGMSKATAGLTGKDAITGMALGGAKRMAAAIPGWAADRVAMFDGGGVLAPHSTTLAVNNTSGYETVRTAKQEAALGGPLRLDRRDLQALANLIALATARPIEMDGRRVGEAIAEHQYVPMGV